MIMIFEIGICIFLLFYIVKYTCILNNHYFIVQKNIAICEKCGLMKKVVKR
jgi:hypothetical protein